jgi:hypothetical protein
MRLWCESAFKGWMHSQMSARFKPRPVINAP